MMGERSWGPSPEDRNPRPASSLTAPTIPGPFIPAAGSDPTPDELEGAIRRAVREPQLWLVPSLLRLLNGQKPARARIVAADIGLTSDELEAVLAGHNTSTPQQPTTRSNTP